MKDRERSEKALIAVHVSCNQDGDEYHKVGFGDVTAVKWGLTSGHMAVLQTVQVFKDGKLFSEHPFSNVLGVYYDNPEPPAHQEGE